MEVGSELMSGAMADEVRCGLPMVLEEQMVVQPSNLLLWSSPLRLQRKVWIPSGPASMTKAKRGGDGSLRCGRT